MLPKLSPIKEVMTRVKILFGLTEKSYTVAETTDSAKPKRIAWEMTTFALITCGSTITNKNLLEVAGISRSVTQTLLDLSGCLTEEQSNSGVMSRLIKILELLEMIKTDPKNMEILLTQSGKLDTNIGEDGSRPVGATTTAE